MVDKREALDVISRNPWAAIVLSFDGQIAEVVPFAGEPTAETFLAFTRTHPGSRKFRLIRQGDLTEEQLDVLIADVMRPGDLTEGRAAEGPTVPEWESSLHPFSAARSIAEAIAEFVGRRSK